MLYTIVHLTKPRFKFNKVVEKTIKHKFNKPYQLIFRKIIDSNRASQYDNNLCKSVKKISSIAVWRALQHAATKGQNNVKKKRVNAIANG